LNRLTLSCGKKDVNDASQAVAGGIDTALTIKLKDVPSPSPPRVEKIAPMNLFHTSCVIARAGCTGTDKSGSIFEKPMVLIATYNVRCENEPVAFGLRER